MKRLREAEGIDISDYLKMELQLEAISDTKAVRNYRDNYFKKLGFGIITLQAKRIMALVKAKENQLALL